MIIFKCQRCKYKQEVPVIKYFKQCPKCKETIFLNYYEHNYVSDTSETLHNVLKGGEENMVTKKKATTKATAKTTQDMTKDDIIKSADKIVKYMKEDLSISKDMLLKINHIVWKTLKNGK